MTGVEVVSMNVILYYIMVVFDFVGLEVMIFYLSDLEVCSACVIVMKSPHTIYDSYSTLKPILTLDYNVFINTQSWGRMQGFITVCTVCKAPHV